MDGPRQILITQTKSIESPHFLLQTRQPLISAVSIGTLDIQSPLQFVWKRHQGALTRRNCFFIFKKRLDHFNQANYSFSLYLIFFSHICHVVETDFFEMQVRQKWQVWLPSFSFLHSNPLTSVTMVSHRSTKGASKARRDHINHEIRNMRALLPITQEDQERLSYLHSMAAICTYIRKSVFFQGKSSNFSWRFLNYKSAFSVCHCQTKWDKVCSSLGDIHYIRDNRCDDLQRCIQCN